MAVAPIHAYWPAFVMHCAGPIERPRMLWDSNQAPGAKGSAKITAHWFCPPGKAFAFLRDGHPRFFGDPHILWITACSFFLDRQAFNSRYMDGLSAVAGVAAVLHAAFLVATKPLFDRQAMVRRRRHRTGCWAVV